MNRRRSALLSLLLAAMALSLLKADSCNPDLVDNPGFDVWCGEKLCGWEVEEGSVEKVPTWHRRDHGAALVGRSVAIAQYIDVDSDALDCLAFELIAEVEEGVTLTLEMDFLDDGTVEYSHPIPTYDWTPIRYEVRAPTWFDGVRVRVRKQGERRATLAQVGVRRDSNCGGQPLDLGARPLGAHCDVDRECASRVCAATNQIVIWGYDGPTCAECRYDYNCEGEGAICGTVEGTYGYHRACIAPSSQPTGSPCSSFSDCISGKCGPSGVCWGCAGDWDCGIDELCGLQPVTGHPDVLQCEDLFSNAIGEPCVDDNECSTRVCCEGVCSECCDGEGCEEGKVCERAHWDLDDEWDDDEGALPFVEELLPPPHQCSPGQRDRLSYLGCFGDDDCATGSCMPGDGDLERCLDGGSLCERDEDCGAFGCFVLGARHGECR